MSKKNLRLASLALSAMGIVMVCLISGCRKDEEKSAPQKPLDEVYSFENNQYQRDPIFREQITKLKSQSFKIADRINEVEAKLHALEDECGGIANALTNAAYVALKEERQKLERAFSNNRVRAQQIVGARIKRALSDSERIKNGEAKPKDLSKEEK